jgi:YbbR domain-containing protein
MNQRILQQIFSSRVVSVLFAICLMAAVALPVAVSSTSEKEQPERQASEAPTAEAVTTKAIRVIYDPETGEIISVPLRGTKVLSAPLAKALTRSTEGLQVFDLANGGKGVHLDGRFQHALMVRVRPDGSIETVCTSHSHAAEKFLQAKPTGVDAEPRDK